eukprot:GFYU01001533.1.p1 GENE.GFYU01001533.1~~GFYU01001533.1.p1  ORF type:complete len:1074 (+),score=199.66 GFYU01001533.1:124-3345(+)
MHNLKQPNASALLSAAGQTVNIKVAVRVRPTIRHGLVVDDAPESTPLNFDDSTIEGKEFNGVFGPYATQQAIFKSAVEPVVEEFFEGRNASILAYGQTGSGKTHTMLGPEGGKAELHSKSQGVVPRVAGLVFERIKAEENMFRQLNSHGNSDVQAQAQAQAQAQFQVRISCVELYNDTLKDLLAQSEAGPSTKPRGVPVSLRQSTETGNFYIEGALQPKVETVEDVMKCIRTASKNRTTSSTGMNIHSSRSHAVFVLYLEHRWKPSGADKNVTRKSVSVMNLVDLAGSEWQKRTGNTGLQLKESAHINTGLFTLGKVIGALNAQQEASSKKAAPHIPYRDSLITKVLQGSLGGDSHTVMIACVSPEGCDRDETVGTLQFAASAMCVQNMTFKHIEDVVEYDIWDDDLEDPDLSLNRRCVWIDTMSYGDVYARCLGDPEDDLVLFVHGSGPTNSSTFWNGLVHEMALICPKPCYYVAIDCPGYGQTKGDRQTIRSNPAHFLRDVVSALGREDACCLVGSSQGACAVFNAVLDDPTLTRHIAVMDPVGHDVFRYSAISQPCLLVFDTEDAGHPVKVGRWMKKNLQHCLYHEFAASKEPYWHTDHMAIEMVKLLTTFSQGCSDGGRKRKGSVDGKCRPLGGLTKRVSKLFNRAVIRVAGGLVRWAENYGYGEPIKQIDEGYLQPPSQHLDNIRAHSGSGPSAPAGYATSHRRLVQTDIVHEQRMQRAVDEERDEWEVSACGDTGRILYTNKSTGDSTHIMPAVLKTRPLPTGQTEVTPTGATQGDLFDESIGNCDEVEAESEVEREERLALERTEEDCGVCSRMLWNPIRVNPCRHSMCQSCYEESAVLMNYCPMCDCKVSVKDAEQDPQHQVYLESLDPARTGLRELEFNTDVRRQSADLRIVFEYGNTAAKFAGLGKPGAHDVTAFIKCVKVVRGTQYAGPAVSSASAIARVDFDINPDFPQYAVKVLKKPFELQRTMASRFPCSMTVHFVSSSGLPPVRIPYEIRHDKQKNISRAVVVIPSGAASSKKTAGGSSASAPSTLKRKSSAAAITDGGSGRSPIRLIQSYQRPPHVT